MKQRTHLSDTQRQAALDLMMIRSPGVAVARFFVVLFLSVVIATVGMLQNSAAVVIGAMMIAPLMSPIIGISASVVLGWRSDIIRGAALVFSSIAGAIFIAYVIALVLPAAGSSLPIEVLARTSPDVRDLVVALAAGAAGSYALIHRDVSGALPGVAVAVALVPPLAAMGVLLGRNQVNLAYGAGVLFVTNLFGIILAAGVVLILTGFVPKHSWVDRKHNIYFSLTLILLPTLILGVFLSMRFIQVADHARQLRLVTTAIVNWLGPVDDLTGVNVNGSTVQVDVTGKESPPAIEDLTSILSNVIGKPTTVDLRWIPLVDGPTPSPTVPALSLEQVRPIVESWLQEQSLQLDGLTFDGSTLVVTLSGAEPPGSSNELTDRIATTFGKRIPISLNWTRTPLANTPDGSGNTASSAVALSVAQSWVDAHPDVYVLGASQSGSTIVVTLMAHKAPVVTVLKKELQQALPHLAITIQWVSGTILNHSNALATPSPTPS